ncbi:MAG: hypothetical protein AAB798_02590 [Patescibacteria group bacterium]
MTTATRQRVQVSLSMMARRLVPALARKHHVPAATLVSELIDTALELEEDSVLSKIADERFVSKSIRWMSHNAAWKKHLGRSIITRK